MKPTEMGLHSKVCCEIKVSGNTPKEQAFVFSEYSDDEVFKFIDKYNDAMWK